MLRADDASVRDDISQLYVEKDALEFILDAKRNINQMDSELVQNRGAVTVPALTLDGPGRDGSKDN